MSFKVMRQWDIVEVEINEQDSGLSSFSDVICNFKKLCHQFLDKVINRAPVDPFPSVPNTCTMQFYENI